MKHVCAIVVALRVAICSFHAQQGFWNSSTPQHKLVCLRFIHSLSPIRTFVPRVSLPPFFARYRCKYVQSLVFILTALFLDLCLPEYRHTHYVSLLLSVRNAQISPYSLPRPLDHRDPRPLRPNPSPSLQPLDPALAQISLRAPSRDMQRRRRLAYQQRRHKVFLLLDQQRRR